MSTRAKFISCLGTLLIFLGLSLIFLIFGPVLLQEAKYHLDKVSPEQHSPVESQPVSFDFSLVIPKIGVNALVFANIDSSRPEEYLPVLKKGVAHAQGSRLPNQSGVVFIFAHSTDAFYNVGRYNALFFLLNKLVEGDEVYVFYKNRKYPYEISEKMIVEPSEIVDELKGLEGNVLVLQTCWPSGTTLKRLMVVGKAID